jgi:inorganic pyrophosphatase
MKLTKDKLKEMIKEELLNEIQIEIEDVQDVEASIFDIIIEFRDTFQKSEWKKNRKINTYINQLFKIEKLLDKEVSELK